MNNLHRELAPISGSAWAQFGEKASRTLKGCLASRRAADIVGPKGVNFSAAGSGYGKPIQGLGDGIPPTLGQT